MLHFRGQNVAQWSELITVAMKAENIFLFIFHLLHDYNTAFQ